MSVNGNCRRSSQLTIYLFKKIIKYNQTFEPLIVITTALLVCLTSLLSFLAAALIYLMLFTSFSQNPVGHLRSLNTSVYLWYRAMQKDFEA